MARDPYSRNVDPGSISSKAAKKYPGILDQTKHQAAKMADFDEKDGVRDQGGIKDKGHAAAATDHIQKNQRASSAIASKPSKGGSVNKGGQFGRGQIDDGEYQAPAFPAGSKAKKGKKGTPSRLKGKIPAQGGQYGGGGRDTQ